LIDSDAKAQALLPNHAATLHKHYVNNITIKKSVKHDDCATALAQLRGESKTLGLFPQRFL
jgi:hypothetical protein